jgi:hypothetical protein
MTHIPAPHAVRLRVEPSVGSLLLIAAAGLFAWAVTRRRRRPDPDAWRRSLGADTTAELLENLGGGPLSDEEAADGIIYLDLDGYVVPPEIRDAYLRDHQDAYLRDHQEEAR